MFIFVTDIFESLVAICSGERVFFGGVYCFMRCQVVFTVIPLIIVIHLVSPFMLFKIPVHGELLVAFQAVENFLIAQLIELTIATRE